MQPQHYTVPPISVPNVFNPIELDFDSFTEHIYWIDTHSKEVKRTRIVGGPIEVLLNTGKCF